MSGSEIKVHNGIEAVISLVKLDQAVAVECAIKVLINMSNDEQLCHDIADFNVIPALIQALSFQSVMSATYFTCCLLTLYSYIAKTCRVRN